jgi:GT2 family glycosyltransferase
VLVDDASTDGTADAVEAMGSVDVIRLQRNLGAAARNAGLRAVDAPYVAFCDDDSWFAPGSLRLAADLLDHHPGLAAVNAHILVGPDERPDPSCEDMARARLPPTDGQPGHPLLSFIACGVVVRRAAVLEVGGFCERLGLGGEEELLGWDLAAAGWHMSYVPEVLAHHHPPPNDGRPERREQLLRNKLLWLWLRRPARTAAARTLEVLRRAPRDRFSARAVARAAAAAPWVLRERRVGPPHVEAMCRQLERPD